MTTNQTELEVKQPDLRQVVLDTETTGMNRDGLHYIGHKIIEIGCVELINRRPTGRHFHVYVNPQMPVDPEAFAVHGISDEMLADKPTFDQISDEFVEFIKGADLVIHNAPFDIGFMDFEFGLLAKPIPKTHTFCSITDTLVMAKRMRPGQRNNLDALSKVYGLDTSRRTLHGALLDAEILAEVYLLMTGGQRSLNLRHQGSDEQSDSSSIQLVDPKLVLSVIAASDPELIAHAERLALIKKGGSCLWLGE